MSSSRTAALCRHALALLLALLPAAALAQGGSYTVTSLADSGPGTLREAMASAESDGGPSTITFDPALAGGTIALLSGLPPLWEGGTSIDADLGGNCTPDIALDGSQLGFGNSLSVDSSGNLVRGLAIHGFPPCGFAGELVINGPGASGNVVECTWIGLDLAGSPSPGHCYGIKVHGGASDNRIGPGNRITASAADGIGVEDGNNGGYPEFVGLTPDLVTVVDPIDLTDEGCSFLRQRGGAVFFDSGGHPFTENIGLRLTGRITVVAEGDYSFSLSNLDDQGRLFVLDETLIDWPGGGVPEPVVKHLGVGSHLLRLDYQEWSGHAGLRLEVTGPQPATLTTTGNTGGCGSGLAGLCGQFYQLRVPSERNRITANAIWSNNGNGIALGWGCSPQPNDPDDLDLGPNTVLNYPALTGVSWAQIPGSPDVFNVSGTAPPGATVEVFVGEGIPDSHGEGKVYLGDGVADGNGDFSFPVEIPLGLTAPRLTATATDAIGNTSEFALNLEWENGHDEVTVAGGTSGLPDTVIEVPIYVRDLSHSPLGRDRPTGERIQGFAIKVAWEPAGAVVFSDFARAGITAALNPSYATVVRSGNTASYVLHFDEGTDPVPFTLDAAAPGDRVATLLLTLAPSAPAGPVTVTLDPVTALSNQAGTLEETAGLGTLALVSGSLTVESNAVRDLLAMPVSASEIRLTWADPDLNETGFRVERSPDGSAWSSLGTVGPEATEYLDTGLAPATLYYYRLVTLLASGDGHASHAAAATTHAAVAAHVCALPLSGPRSLIWQTAIARGPGEWAVVWADQVDGRQADLYFQRLADGDLSPVGPRVQVVATDAVSSVPALYWNGTHYGLFWREAIRAEAGPQVMLDRHFFALLNPDGTKVRGDVPLPTLLGSGVFNFEHTLGWDGTHWGLFLGAWTTFPYQRLLYYRLDADGDLVTGPVELLEPPGEWISSQAVAFAPGPGVWGLAWNQNPTWYADSEVWFQRVEASGALVGPAVSLGTFTGPDQGVAIAWDPATPPDGAWVVVWSEGAGTLDGTDYPVLLRKVAADGTVLGTAPTRISDDFDPVTGTYDQLPTLAVTGSGEARAFAMSVDPDGAAYELGMLRADVDGLRLGTRTYLTPLDYQRIDRPHVARSGDEQALVFSDSTSGPMEVSALRVDAAGNGGPQTWVTSGHSMFGGAAMAWSGLAPLGSGFVALWADRLTSDPGEASRLYCRIVDGTGATVADLQPFGSATSWQTPALVAVGDEFAVAWRPLQGGVRFARHDAAGNPLTGEVTVTTSGAAPLALGFDGERYGVVFRRGNPDGWRFVPVWPDGSVAAPETLLFGPTALQPPILLWAGNGWALIWRGSNSLLYFGLFDRDGNVLLGPVPLTGPPMNSARNQFAAAFDGGRILVAWSDHPGADPPATDVYYTIVELDGAVVVPPTIAAGTANRATAPQVAWRDGAFRVLYASSPVGGGVEEIAIDRDGVVQPGVRLWTNTGSPAAAATNGAATALAWAAGELHLMTDACLDDATPPPCPELAIASVGRKVRLTWTGGDDPESGHWRTLLLRGEAAVPGSERGLAELFPETAQYVDGGFGAGTTHTYQALAMNRAFQLSDGCPLLSYSTLRGDANGNGLLDIADIFYLINHLLAGGPPPLGDADANASGGVTVADIFYLINYFFSGGPAPEWSGETTRIAATEPAALAEREAIETEAAAERPRSTLALGKASARAGATIAIPVTLLDAAGTPLGRDRAAEDPIQALALHVNVLPAGAVTAIELRRVGVLAKYEPLFESRPVHTSDAALVVSFDEAFAPLAISALGATASRTPPATPVAEVVVTLSRELAPGTVVELRLDPGTTLLSNQAGTVSESAANGWLALADGRIEVLP
jgi:hypothetical protein